MTCWRASSNDDDVTFVEWFDNTYTANQDIDTEMAIAIQLHDSMSFDVTNAYFTNKISEAESLYGIDTFSVEYDLTLSERQCAAPAGQDRAFCFSYKSMSFIFN